MTREELLQKIREAESDKATKFDIENKGLTELPAEIGRLINLQSLNVSGNQISELPKEIAELSNLEELYLIDNQLRELPKEITKLTNLQVLTLSGNQIRELPSEITKLINLQSLELRDLQLRDLPNEIAELNNLQELYLSGNRLIGLPRGIAELTDLKVLDLLDNQLREFPSEITELINLEVLDLSGNQLSHLPKEITKLTNLNEFHLSGNRLTEFPIEIYQFDNLTVLNLDEYQLNNFISSVVKLKGVGLSISKNDEAFSIPAGVIEGVNSSQELLDYYSQIQRGDGKKLNEAKILVVGQANAGKTSLIDRLINNNYEPDRKPTNGIKIYAWRVEIDDRNIQLNVWDFGGQEIYYATHQFFLTKRSLYILLIDSTLDKEENRIDYWLEKIRILGGSSPVLIVGNKIEERQTDINLGGLSRKYPNIRGFHQISCKTEKGLAELKTDLIEEISNLDGLNDVLPASWFNVKEELENMNEEYVSYETYLEVCRLNGITEEDIQNKLLERLHDLGIVLNFGNRIQDTNVLNPHWVTKGVYDILNAKELFKSKGILKQEMLSQILESEKYPTHKQLFIVNIMREFELCFAIDTERSFLVPDLLSEEEQNTGSWADSLGFEYHYNVFFGSIITRLIVKMHKSISKSTYWRTGVVLEYKVGNEVKNEALVKADTAERKIIIAIRGDEHTRRDFLSIIRGKFEEIHRSFPEEFEENVAEKVPVPGHPESVVDYKHLLNLERMREESIIPEGLTEKFFVKDLLNGIEAVEERQKQREKDRFSDVISASVSSSLTKNVGPQFSLEEVERLNKGKGLETTAINLTTLIEFIIGAALIGVPIYKRDEIINRWLNGNFEPITFIYLTLVVLGVSIVFFAFIKKQFSIEWVDGKLVKIIRWLAFKVKGESLSEYQDLCRRLEGDIKKTDL